MSGFGVGRIFSSRQVECDIEKVDNFFVGFNCYFQAITTENIAQIFFDELSLPW